MVNLTEEGTSGHYEGTIENYVMSGDNHATNWLLHKYQGWIMRLNTDNM